MRALVRFGKMRRLRFVSHLDLQRAMQMALRRTDLPIAYSQGFNPHPQIAFASALAVGHTSDYEVLDIKLAHDDTKARVFQRMSFALPKDLPVEEVCLVEDNYPSMMAIVAAADYEISIEGDAPGRMVEEFLAQSEVFAMRKTKSGESLTDIRPMAKSLQWDGTILRARLALTERATLKPDLLTRALFGEDATASRVHRLALLKESGADYAPLLEGF
jgi:radical SAM-linked protein